MRCFLPVFLMIVSLAGPAVAVEKPAPILILEQDPTGGGGTSLWVETILNNGEPVRHLLGSDMERFQPGATGWSPEGRSGFVTWSAGTPRVRRRGGSRRVGDPVEPLSVAEELAAEMAAPG